MGIVMYVYWETSAVEAGVIATGIGMRVDERGQIYVGTVVA
jgi:hypothetical protein